VQISSKTPDRFLKEASRVIRKGYGFPSVFNSDRVVDELVRQGKSLEDAREGGTSGCVETGAFGKEAYILTGYFNLPKVLELALNDGVDPRTGMQLGPRTGDPRAFVDFEDLLRAFETQMCHFLDIKIRGNDTIERIYAERMPAPFLSLITDDCIANGLDYNEGGARYNTSYIQGVGIGTITDSLAAIRKHIFRDGTVSMGDFLEALLADFDGAGRLRQILANRSPKWGNDDDEADELMQHVFNAYFDAIDGRPNQRGGNYHIDMLPTTCHVYFGSVTGATPDGRRAWTPLSEGISPVQGADRRGPTAVFLSAAKMDHARTGGTLLTGSPASSGRTSGSADTTSSSTWSRPTPSATRRSIPRSTATSSSASRDTATTSATSPARSRTRSSPARSRACLRRTTPPTAPAPGGVLRRLGTLASAPRIVLRVDPRGVLRFVAAHVVEEPDHPIEVPELPRVDERAAEQRRPHGEAVDSPRDQRNPRGPDDVQDVRQNRVPFRNGLFLPREPDPLSEDAPRRPGVGRSRRDEDARVQPRPRE